MQPPQPSSETQRPDVPSGLFYFRQHATSPKAGLSFSLGLTASARGRRSLVQIQPPQLILLIRKGLLDVPNRPFFFLGKIWERNYFSIINLRLSGAEGFTEFFCRVPHIIGENVSAVVCHAALAVAQMLPANLLGDSQRVHYSFPKAKPESHRSGKSGSRSARKQGRKPGGRREHCCQAVSQSSNRVRALAPSIRRRTASSTWHLSAPSAP